VGAGPAGLEATVALADRGYDVTLAEATDTLGGRVAKECKLPGLSAWGRVADYRSYQLSQKANVEIYLNSKLDTAQILEFGFENVCIATGSHWRSDGVARQHLVPPPIDTSMPVLTPDDIMAGKQLPTGKVVVFDDDHYYMGGVLAELLANHGCEVTLITPSPRVSEWTFNTLEQVAIHQRLVNAGVDIVLNKGLASVESGVFTSNCVFTDATLKHECDAVLMVASRTAESAVYIELKERESNWADAGIKTVNIIGDANAPGPIAWATYAGHRYARELDSPVRGDVLSFRREVTGLQV